MIGTPDHWHTKMVVDACRAGKDVYVEKPLTLTVDEGKLLCKVVKETGRVVQVGSWQRSDWRFRLACEMVLAGRIGKLRKVTLTVDGNPAGGPFQPEPAPPHLNWDMWLGQAPNVPYIKERCHYTFRWWYEYAGGKVADWGAHMFDIAQWGIGSQMSGPVEIDGRADTLPDQRPNCYNVPPKFSVTMRYANGVEVNCRCEGRVGVMFEGDKGRLFVSRASIVGKPVENLIENPLPKEKYRLYANDNLAQPLHVDKKDPNDNHMFNFFDCVKSRQTPISDVVSQHRSATACHLANISIRLKRRLKWDPENELFVGDEEANQWLHREQRKPYQVDG